MIKLCALATFMISFLFSNTQFDNLLEKMAKELQLPGFNVAIVKGNEVIYKKCSGYKNLENKKLMTADDLFCIGSISKGMTGIALGTLVDRHQLDWNDRVISYLPEFFISDPVTSATVTIKDLLTHQWGLNGRFDSIWLNNNLSKRELMKRLRHIPTVPLRQEFFYQNISYTVLGLVIEQITGMSFTEYLKKSLTDPLLMKSTTTDYSAIKKSSYLAQGYRLSPHPEPTFLIDPEVIAPAGGVFSSLNDMIKYAKMLNQQGESILDPSTFQKITSPHVITNLLTNSFGKSDLFSFESYGLGWHLVSYQGIESIYHAGNIEGYSTMICYIPHDNTTIIVLSNLSNTLFPSFTCGAILDRLYDKHKNDWIDTYSKYSEFSKDPFIPTPPAKELRKNNTSPSLSLNKYAGIYKNSAYNDVKITCENEELAIHFNNYRSTLKHWHYDSFITQNSECPYFNDLLIQFHHDVEGEIYSITLPIENSSPPFIFTKDADIAYNHNHLKENSGIYCYKDWAISLEEKNNLFTIHIKNCIGITVFSGEVVSIGKGKFAVRDHENYSFFFSKKQGHPHICLITPKNAQYNAKRKI